MEVRRHSHASAPRARLTIVNSSRRELERMLHFGYKAETEILADADNYRRQANQEGASKNALVAFVRDKLRQALDGIETE